MSDISKKLRDHVTNRGGAIVENGAWAMMVDAADEIARLTTELNDLRNGEYLAKVVEERDRLNTECADKDAENALLRKEAKALQDLNADAHGIVARIWSILGNPSYDELNGRTVYDLVQQQRDALAPFAAVAEHDIGEGETDQDRFTPMTQQNARAPVLLVGHLRAARAAHSTKGEA